MENKMKFVNASKQGQDPSIGKKRINPFTITQSQKKQTSFRSNTLQLFRKEPEQENAIPLQEIQFEKIKIEPKKAEDLYIDWAIKTRIVVICDFHIKPDPKKDVQEMIQFSTGQIESEDPKSLFRKDTLTKYLYSWFHQSKDWKLSMQSLYLMLKNFKSDYFYYICEFTVLFYCKDGQILAQMNKSTPGLRSMLQSEGIEYVENVTQQKCDSDSEDEPEEQIENYSLTFIHSVHALYDFLLNYNAQPKLLSNKSMNPETVITTYADSFNAVFQNDLNTIFDDGFCKSIKSLEDALRLISIYCTALEMVVGKVAE
ncbi:hypothetical protein HDV04_002497 [Boothiomyces sp. JEL0838]|nr:hypothetical protein HDV04_002497 [Boothiomyces sp. JEL0838]